MHRSLAVPSRGAIATSSPQSHGARPGRWLMSCVAAGVLGLGASASAAPLSDAQILGIYIQVNSFDIETALLGRSLAGSDAVRQLAEHVSSDHLGVRAAAYELAATCGVAIELPGARDADAVAHDKVMTQLSGLHGGAFDSSYLQHEIAFHSAAIGAVRSALLPSATCPALQAHFRAVLPAFEHHLAMTESLAAK